MAASFGIANRLGRGLILQAAYISVAVLLGVFAVFLLFEDVLTKQALENEANYFWARYEQDKNASLPNTYNMIGYVSADTPEEFVELNSGYHDVRNGDAVVLVDLKEGERLVLVYNRAQVGELLLLFGLVPLILVLIVIYLTLYGAYRVTRRTVSPVIQLANRVKELNPAEPQSDLFRLEEQLNSEDEVSLLADAMADLADRLSAFSERERNFTRDASHELRSPLTVIKLATQMLDQESLSESAKVAVERIRDNAKDMEELTEAFLLLARESKEADLADVHVAEVVASEIDRARIVAADSPVEIRFEQQGELIVKSPAKVVATVVGNLIRNAMNYIDAGTVTVTVDVRSVTVADTGPGMSQEDIENAFVPFHRGERQRGGFGVGLTIVKRLADRFGWTIQIESEVGIGTSVHIEFAG